MVDKSKRLMSLIDVNPKNEILFNYEIKKTITSSIRIANISKNGFIEFIFGGRMSQHKNINNL